MREINIEISADVGAFMNALRRAYESLALPGLKRQRIRRMHSAYSRKRGRGRW